MIDALRVYLASRRRDELARQGRSFPVVDRWVTLAMFAVAAVATWSSVRSGRILMFSDAQSHLVIARRLIDGPARGIGQLGTVWLPLPHLLLVPFVAATGLWHNGLGGSILGGLCLAATAVSIRRIAFRMTGSNRAGLLAVAVLVSSASSRYLFTTALTEPVLLAASCAAVAGVAGWEARGWSYSGGEVVVFCGFPAFATLLARYEGFALIGGLGLYAGVAIFRRNGLRAALKAMRLYAIAPAVATALWLAYNQVFFADALAFQRGVGSSQDQMRARAVAGGLEDMHNVAGSFRTFALLVWDNCGPAAVTVCVLMTLLYLAGVGPRLRSGTVFVLPSLGLFHVFSLWAGQTYMSRTYAVRYGIVMMPFVALMIGALSASTAEWVWKSLRSRSSAWLPNASDVTTFVAVCVLGFGFAQGTTSSLTSLDAQGTTEQEGIAARVSAAHWLKTHRLDQRPILIDDVANPILLKMEVPLADVVSSFTGSTWSQAMKHPSGAAGWALIDLAQPSDQVARAINRHPSGWVIVHRSGTAQILRYDGERDRT